MKRILAGLVALFLFLTGLSVATALPSRAVLPVMGEVVRAFDPPDEVWNAGHRGVDLAASVGTTVVAAMDGVVFFAGMVATRQVISLNHGDLKTTYEPVQAIVHTGDQVRAGQAIGILLAGHACPAEACLHWGLKRGETYLDPLSLLGGGPIRLITADDMAQLRERAVQQRLGGGLSRFGLINPTEGVITSEYGMRIHPIDGTWRFHDGLDIGAACGSPIKAVAAGEVAESWLSPSYGNRLVIDHGVVGAHRLTTSYNHAQSYIVAVGERVTQGQVIGWVGSTGDSTGCHLHFQTWLDGELTDPQALLP